MFTDTAKSRERRINRLAMLLKCDPSGKLAVQYLNRLPVMPRVADLLFREAEKRAFWRTGK